MTQYTAFSGSPTATAVTSKTHTGSNSVTGSLILRVCGLHNGVSIGSPRKAANDIEGQWYHGEDVGLIEGKLAENADSSSSSLDNGR